MTHCKLQSSFSLVPHPETGYSNQGMARFVVNQDACQSARKAHPQDSTLASLQMVGFLLASIWLVKNSW